MAATCDRVATPGDLLGSQRCRPVRRSWRPEVRSGIERDKSEMSERLLSGFRSFHARRYRRRQEFFRKLVQEGQQPEVLVVACSDSRVDPTLLLDADFGELFVVRNVAAIVPHYLPDGRLHATGAALEYGVKVLEVRHILVLGHAHCGGVAAARTGPPADCGDFLAPWTAALADAVGEAPDAAEAERRTILCSLRNLWSYPWIADRLRRGSLELHGWRFDIAAGRLEIYDERHRSFRTFLP